MRNPCKFCSKAKTQCATCKCHKCSQITCQVIYNRDCRHFAPGVYKTKIKSATIDPNSGDLILDLSDVILSIEDTSQGPNMYAGIDNPIGDKVTSDFQISYTGTKGGF